MHRPRPLRVYLRDVVGATGHGLVASLALPDADGLALDGVLAAECADVAGVLRDFHVLHLLTQRGTVPVQVRVIRSFFLDSVQGVLEGRPRRFADRGKAAHTWYHICQ